MSAAANLLWVALWLTLVLVAAKTARRIWPLQQELSRKLVHIGAGLAVRWPGFYKSRVIGPYLLLASPR